MKILFEAGCKTKTSLFMLLSLITMCDNVFASEGAGNWRATYDYVMVWVNFLILVFVILYYARKPMKKFLDGQKDTIGKNIDKIEARNEAAKQEVLEARRALEESNVRFSALKERIIEQGEKSKQAIIDQARHEGRLMIEGAKQKVDGQILQAQRAIKAEIIDAAINLCMNKLPRKMTPEDNQKLVDDYLKIALRQ